MVFEDWSKESFSLGSLLWQDGLRMLVMLVCASFCIDAPNEEA
jgi:hypothetical protein